MTKERVCESEKKYRICLAFGNGGFLSLYYYKQETRDEQFAKIESAMQSGSRVTVTSDNDNVNKIVIDTESLVFAYIKEEKEDSSDEEPEKEEGGISVPDSSDIVDFFRGMN